MGNTISKEATTEPTPYPPTDALFAGLLGAAGLPSPKPADEAKRRIVASAGHGQTRGRRLERGP